MAMFEEYRVVASRFRGVMFQVSRFRDWVLEST